MATGKYSARQVHQVQGAVTAASASRTPRESRAVKRQRRKMMLYFAVALVRDRRFRENAIIAIVILAALAQIARESGASARTSLVAWLDAVPSPVD
jgi:hypothetical protein